MTVETVPKTSVKAGNHDLIPMMKIEALLLVNQQLVPQDLSNIDFEPALKTKKFGEIACWDIVIRSFVDATLSSIRLGVAPHMGQVANLVSRSFSFSCG